LLVVPETVTVRDKVGVLTADFVLLGDVEREPDGVIEGDGVSEVVLDSEAELVDVADSDAVSDEL
jgi:hypothetical protein